MGIGNCCCKGEEFKGVISRYAGRPSTVTQPYLLGGRFQQQNDNRMVPVTRFNSPNYIYDIHVAKKAASDGEKYVAIACGTSGVRIWRTEKLNFSLGKPPDYTYMDNAIEAEQTSFETNPAYNSFHIGSALGVRYGFEQSVSAPLFSGVYGACAHGDYVYLACGTNGVYRIDPTQGTAGIEQLLTGNEETIIKNVLIHDKKLYVSTCGYDKPKFSYSSSFQQGKYQPEYKQDPSNPLDKIKSKVIEPIGIYVYDLEILETTIGQKDLDPDAGYIGAIPIKEHINSIKSSGIKIYVATGSRNDSASGLSGGGALYEVEQSTVEGQEHIFFKKQLYRSVTGSILDMDFNETSIYCVDSSYGVIKDGKQSIQIIQSGSPISDIKEKIEYCADSDVKCTTGWPSFAQYDGAKGVRVLIRDFDAGQGSPRAVMDICPPYNQPYKTRETIDVFPSSISVIKDSICVGLLQGGVAIYKKADGKLKDHISGLYTRPHPCSDFKKEGQYPTEYDANPEFTLSTGKMVKYGGRAYAIDCIQYIANGSGPGVYSPVSRSENVRNFVGLIKNYKPFSGVFEII